jgi:periplasmic protein TonB
MNSILAEQLDQRVTALLAGAGIPALLKSPVDELMQVASGLRTLPRAAFREELGARLTEQAFRMRHEGASSPTDIPIEEASDSSHSPCEPNLEPPQFHSLGFPSMRRANLAASFALHVVALAGILTSGLWVVGHGREMSRQFVTALSDSPYLLAPARGDVHGGGGGGDHDKLAASKGTAPRFAAQRIVPPTVVVRNEEPKLSAELTLVGPPEVHLPQSEQAGDPLSKIFTLSNGSGSEGGIGSGQGGGIGVGTGPGIGPGEGGGLGGGIYHVGGGVTAPRPIYDPDPEYSEEARKAKYQGSVVLQAVISPDGRPRDLRVVRSLGMGLDDKAIQAVGKWKFEPALKDGRPVAVLVQIEVAFRLY